MQNQPPRTARKQRKLPLFVAAGALIVAFPTASLALVGFSQGSSALSSSAYEIFTPASVDPDLVASFVKKSGDKSIRFTPAGSNPALRDRTVTVAVRVDDGTAQAVSVRKAIEAAPGAGQSLATLQSSKFNLGTARGYQSFARQIELPSTVRNLPGTVRNLPGTVRNLPGTVRNLPGTVRNLDVPDLSEFEPSRPSAEDKPSRLQPRISLEEEAIAGRSPNTLDALEAQVDVGGSFRISKNLDVTAGLRYSQERDRLDPLTDSVQDSQAVYVGTQIRF